MVLNRTNSGGPLQTSQLSGLATEQLQDAELMQHYGFTSCPLPGTVGVVIPLGGVPAIPSSWPPSIRGFACRRWKAARWQSIPMKGPALFSNVAGW
ncbi:phage baseplate assembly protein [Erwinia aphidicola]|uniref:phage baseplate assembly protein n=1 Tax=Erwinia aphidicola TaxID=68334 RepID=UPI0030CE3CE8